MRTARDAKCGFGRRVAANYGIVDYVGGYGGGGAGRVVREGFV